jgi:hypothetical protein
MNQRTDNELPVVTNDKSGTKRTDRQEPPLYEHIIVDGIDVIYEKVKNSQDWVKTTERVSELVGAIRNIPNETYPDGCTKICDIFSFDHHKRSATELWNQINLNYRARAVVFGHKNHGKTQFLFFLLRVLQEMGEYVVYFDKTIIPVKRDKETNMLMIDSSHSQYCVKYWRDQLCNKMLTDELKSRIDEFDEVASLSNFREFMQELKKYSRSSKQRVWVIVDEVPALDKEYDSIPLLELPEEQMDSPFNFIVTGSAGMGKWVGDQHLEKSVFDLPPFTKEEGMKFASSLLKSFDKTDIEFAEYFGDISVDGIGDCLEEMFGGIPGYVAECILYFSNNRSFTDYGNALKQRIESLIDKASNKESLLKEINESKWKNLRNLGLCGSKSPRGIIFSLLLKELLFHSHDPVKSQWRQIQNIRGQCNDPGLDGCLLELEVILQLKSNSKYMKARLISNQNETHTRSSTDGSGRGKSITLPSLDSKWSTVYLWDGDGLRISLPLDYASNTTTSDTFWELLILPVGFPVADVVMTNKNIARKNRKTANKKAKLNIAPTLQIYYIQITRSLHPFSKHKTIDTCSNKSKEKIDMLTNKIASQHKMAANTVEKHFVLYAPNCQSPSKQPASYYFSTD